MSEWDEATSTNKILDDLIAASRWSAADLRSAPPITSAEFRQWDALETVRCGAIARWNEAQR